MSFFGTNIKKIRQVKGLSQKAFADLFDLNRGVISSYEEGRAEPKIETILKVANHFNLNLDKLLTETLQVNQLVSVSDIDQLMLFPELAIQNSKEAQLNTEKISLNESVLQKILASVDLVYEFTAEKALLAQYQYGDILFLNKADLKTESSNSLLIYQDETLSYLTDNKETNKQNSDYYKIVGYVSMREKNIFASIFERLENLEKKAGSKIK
ncbi:transcriptional regulator with XRE-family HTH domain [Chryseobacterium bernardetii]|uniref:Helix-turn-helix protein n=3 Tax=Chryseobacterium TaxID=59732 RepID=A0A543EB70_9FLAO|nr:MULTISPECIES: helix-turn-helix transcriptional regulator [Chryseobacterium]MDR6371588.1 transcriptional regulator with XRE-family HTH domain [Chryseobacterium vietnamense]MDR6441908.1 transcriptional regulator with XRE-family HTH domain [Chryseobacterium bernardetii]TQM18786.1 helix-turn-helix protein [Chryseobacterium aquifrigidense]